jgi:dienelactone hydrolase
VTTSRSISYSHAGAELTGYLYVDDSGDPQPGLLLIHGGAGLDDHSKGQAERYAALGWTVFACDMFGSEFGGDREQAMALLMQLRDKPAFLAERAIAGLEQLQAQPEARAPFAAVGFCFGGMTAVTLARKGADVAGVISMHGALKTSEPAAAGDVTAKVLVCHGSDDPHVPLPDVEAFIAEMTAAGADWQLISYGNAVHGFTHTHAKPGDYVGVAYHEPTDRRSFQAATTFLEELASPAS